MSARRIEGGLWSLAALAGVLAVAGWRSGLTAQGPAAVTAITSRVPPPEPFDTDALQVATDSIAAGDPFRFEHRPSSVPYTVQAEGAPPPSPLPPKPKISVVGIIGGPPWEAVVEGIPGREGSVVVRQGETVGPLQFTSIKRDTVVVQGADTTWHLTLRRAW